MSLTPNQKKLVRSKMTDFCVRAEAHENVWHYTQQRPFHGFGVVPEQWHANDCSGYVSLVFNWAMHQTGLYLADPLGWSYSGWGNTGSEILWLRKHGKHIENNVFYVGDLAVYGDWGNTEHTTVCRKNGSASTSRWSSFGSESGPKPEGLKYRSDLIGVWRHPALL